MLASQGSMIVHEFPRYSTRMCQRTVHTMTLDVEDCSLLATLAENLLWCVDYTSTAM